MTLREGQEASKQRSQKVEEETARLKRSKNADMEEYRSNRVIQQPLIQKLWTSEADTKH